MKFDEAIGIGTQSGDVEGVPKVVAPVVRRKVKIKPVADIRPRKKKKDEDEEDEEEVDIEEMYAGLPPPTQAAPTQDINYQLRYWQGDRPEYDDKEKFVSDGKQKKKKMKKRPTKKVGLMVTTTTDGDPKKSSSIKIENVMKTRDAPPNYLNKSMSPFFMKANDEFEHEPKKNHLNKPPKKKGKKKKDADRQDDTDSE